MEHLSLQKLEDLLRRHRPSREVRKMTRGVESLRDRYAVVDELARITKTLRSWAEAETEQQKAVIQTDIDRLTGKQESLHGQIADRYREVGIEVDGTDLETLHAAWPVLSDLLAQQQRDREILGQDHRSLEVNPLTGDLEERSVLVGREIRDRLSEVDQLAAKIDRRKADHAAINVYTVDEEVLEWEIEFSRKGMVRDPDADGARPRLDPGLVDRLRQVGIALGEDDRQ